MFSKSGREEYEDVVDLSHGEPLNYEHGPEKDEHFPHAHKDVGEITGSLHLLLDLSQILDET